MNKHLIAAAALAAVATASHATTVFDNGVSHVTSGGNETTAWIQANDFTLQSTTTVTGATVYLGSFGAPINESVQYYFFSDVNGQPGTLLASGTATATLTDTHQAWIGSNDVYSASFSTTAFTALAGQTYYLGLHVGDNYSRNDVYWATTGSPSDDYGVESYGGTMDNWSTNYGYHAFSLTSAVPEPTNAAMLALGALGVMGAALRRRSRQA